MNAKGASERDAAGAREAREGALIRFLAPAQKSRGRLLLLAFLMVVWILVLIGLYLETRAQKKAETATGVAMVAELVRLG